MYINAASNWIYLQIAHEYVIHNFILPLLEKTVNIKCSFNWSNENLW